MGHPYTKSWKAHLVYSLVWVVAGAAVFAYPHVFAETKMPRLYYEILGTFMGVLAVAAFIFARLRQYLQRQYYGASQVDDEKNGT